MLTQESAGPDHQDNERRRLKRRAPRTVLAWGAFAALGLALLLWIDPLGSVLGELAKIDPLWLIAAAGLELASCLSYVALFERLFERVCRQSPRKLAWLGLGAGAVLPGGDVAGLAASGLRLHGDGVPKRWLAVRSSVLLVLVNGVGVVATGVAGALLLSGVVAGPHDLLLAGVPILVSAVIVGAVAAIPFAVRRYGTRAPAWIVAVADSVSGAGRYLRRPDWRLLGAAGYPLLDMAALWAVCAATGQAPSFAALVVAYSIGYLASVLPIPAGIGVLDGGLAAALIVYGMSPAVAAAAVLVYHALAIWMPALGGLAASVQLRREQRRPTLARAGRSRRPRLPRIRPLAGDPA